VGLGIWFICCWLNEMMWKMKGGGLVARVHSDGGHAYRLSCTYRDT
jgi:hypothetical protein